MIHFTPTELTVFISIKWLNLKKFPAFLEFLYLENIFLNVKNLLPHLDLPFCRVSCPRRNTSTPVWLARVCLPGAVFDPFLPSFGSEKLRFWT
jgi:hypothetical protein